MMSQYSSLVQRSRTTIVWTILLKCGMVGQSNAITDSWSIGCDETDEKIGSRLRDKPLHNEGD